MKIPKLFKKKPSKENQKLIDAYERGEILQIGNDVDNKEHIKKCRSVEDV